MMVRGGVTSEIGTSKSFGELESNVFYRVWLVRDGDVGGHDAPRVETFMNKIGS